jgi:hypothetical protein
MNDPSPLNLATLPELLDELASRFDHAIICGIQCQTTVENGPLKIVRRWLGNAITCAGLGQDIARAVLNDYEARSTET